MRIDDEYRGYRIRYRKTKTWVANVLPPGALTFLPSYPIASREEGKDVLVRRVRSAIDAHIAEAGRNS